METKIIKIDPNYPEEEFIKEAVTVLKKGGVAAFPTETVYGIGVCSLNPSAINRLSKIKKRPRNKSFSLLISRFETLKELKINLSEQAKKTINKFWPGPLTIIVSDQKKKKIGLRMPKNRIALALINTLSHPISTTSANISGQKPAVSYKEIDPLLKSSMDIIIDGGNVEIGIASTVVDMTAYPFKVLREGAISKKDILSDYHVLFVCTGNSCRSVMAKALLEQLLKQSGMSNNVYVDSAGTFSHSGISAVSNTIEVLKEENIDVSMHKGKKITSELLKKSDLIFVMEQSHKDIIANKPYEMVSKVKLLKEKENIPDPIGKSIEEYRNVKNIIKDSVENIFLELFKKSRG